MNVQITESESEFPPGKDTTDNAKMSRKIQNT